MRGSLSGNSGTKVATVVGVTSPLHSVTGSGQHLTHYPLTGS